MKKILAMFPGQGSQYVGMAQELYSQEQIVRDTFAEASETICLDLAKLCFEGPEERLKLTENTQPAILCVSIALWRLLHQRLSINVDAFAGHSLGEYSALVASGLLDFSRAVYLVRERGKAMQQAVLPGVGAMAAVLGCPADELEELCRALSQPQSVVEPVNYNSPQQIVVAGHKEAVETLMSQLAERSVKAIALPVSAPFHSSLMRPARALMQPLLAATVLRKESDVKVIPNVLGRAVDTYSVELLIEQMDHPVRWTETMLWSSEQSFDVAIEVGPGRVLYGLGKRQLPKSTQLLSLDSFEPTIQTLRSLDL